jgi:hypothetical protein
MEPRAASASHRLGGTNTVIAPWRLAGIVLSRNCVGDAESSKASLLRTTLGTLHAICPRAEPPPRRLIGNFRLRPRR